MPTRPPQPPDPNPDRPPGPNRQAVGYDWARFGRHRLRAPNGAIVDLPVPTTASPTVWVATLWPDPTAPGGWARALWHPDPTGRGWQLPHGLAAGDVVEFGADTTTGPIRWYGIMDSYEVDRWATLQGPYPQPGAAHDAAQQLLALERYVPPLETEPARRPRPCPRAGDPPSRRGRRHRHR